MQVKIFKIIVLITIKMIMIRMAIIKKNIVLWMMVRILKDSNNSKHCTNGITLHYWTECHTMLYIITLRHVTCFLPQWSPWNLVCVLNKTLIEYKKIMPYKGTKITPVLYAVHPSKYISTGLHNSCGLHTLRSDKEQKIYPTLILAIY